MATQNVTDKILEDAKKESQEILKKYRDDAAEMKKTLEEELRSRRALIEDETETLKRGEHMRLLSQKKLEMDKELTARKRTYLEKVIAEALKELPSHGKYGQFLQMLIASSNETEGELSISETDGKKHKSAIEEYAKKEKMNFTVGTDEEIAGGIIIKKGKTTYHGSLKLISELLSDELAIAVSQALYEK